MKNPIHTVDALAPEEEHHVSKSLWLKCLLKGHLWGFYACTNLLDGLHLAWWQCARCGRIVALDDQHRPSRGIVVDRDAGE